jgi:hypothetical protein
MKEMTFKKSLMTLGVALLGVTTPLMAELEKKKLL